MIRVVIADDHTIVRQGLKHVLASAKDLSVIGEASDGHEVMASVRQHEFEVLLLDMSMPGKSGIELIKQIHNERPKLRILVLTMHDEAQYAVRAIRAGAAGYITKESASEQLVAAIRKVASGGAFISPSVAEQFALSAMAGITEEAPHTSLSDREFEVLQMLARGLSVSEMAAQLTLSVKTVSTHKANLMQKMHLANQVELVRYAMRHGLVEQEHGRDKL